MNFSSQDLLEHSSVYNLNSKNFSKSNSQYSSSSINNKKQSILQYAFESNNSFQTESQDYTTSSRNNFQDTISLAQNRIIITKFKLELSSIKKQFINNFESFNLLMKKSCQQILREFMNQVSFSKFSQANNHSSININPDDQIQIREQKIIKLKQKIEELKEENEKLQSKSINDFSFEDQIKERDQIIQSIESDHNDKLMQMNSIIQKLKNKLKSFQDQKYLIIQLQTQIDSKNKEIDQLKTENLSINQKLENLAKQNAIASEDIEYTFNKIEQFKKEIAQYNQENSQLQSQISNLNHELEITKESNLKFSIENKKLKDEINQKEDQILSSISSKNSLINQIKEKDEIIDKVQNELSILNAEKSLNQSISANTNVATNNTNNELDLYCQKYNSKEYRKLQNKVIALNSQIDSQKSQIEEQNNLIQALRENLQQNENEIAIISQNSQKDRSAIIKKEGQTISLKSEIIRLETVINQKEQFIAEMLINDDKKSAELDRLHLDLEEMRNNLRKNENQNNDHLYVQFQEISEELKKYRSKSNQLDLIVKQQKYKLQEIQQENDDLKNELNSTHKKLILISEENNNLQEKFRTITLTYTTNASKMQKVVEFVKNQNLEISKENSLLIKKNLEQQETLNDNKKLIDQISIQNTKLKKENSELIQKRDLFYIPLENDNNRLKKSIDEIRKHEKVLVEENQNLVTQVESLKKLKDTQKNIDDQKIIEKESMIIQIEDENYENQKELEKCQKIIQSILKILNVDSISIVVDTLRKNEKEFTLTKSKLSKILKEKKKIESENKLHKIKIKSQENQIKKNCQIIEDLTLKLNESKKQTDSLNLFVNQSKENFRRLQNSFCQIQNQLESSNSNYINLNSFSPSESKSGKFKQYDFSDNLPLKNP